ncbi:zincin-like metallopeptidase domain-containing protein [Aureispira sp. CCB-QB1]|uniref:zincin-like metallopeptidase domain-containing protein n=1 Tax=Aureispira sp. CCB-QB1 TaxID=1313421 RepID=UPI0006982614
MPKLQQFVAYGTEAYYRVLFHELIYWTGHRSRLARKGIIQMKQKDNLLHNSAAYFIILVNLYEKG